MESNGSFGDLLAAFNIDSEDTDIAEATHQYDEANIDDATSEGHKVNDVPEESIQLYTNQQPAEITTDEQIGPNVNPVKVVYDNSTPTSIIGDAVHTVVASSINTDTTGGSIDGLVSVPNFIPQVATIIPPVIRSPVPQLATDAMLIPNVAQNNVALNQAVVPQAQLQPFVQPIQHSSQLLTNQFPVNGLGLINPDVTGLVDFNGGAVLPHGMLPGITPQTTINQPTTIVNIGGIQNNIVAVPMSLVPPVVNQNTVVTQNNIVTPHIIPGSIMSSPKLSMTNVKLKNDLSQFTHKYRKKKPPSTTPTVQELLEEQRRKKSSMQVRHGIPSQGKIAVAVTPPPQILPMPQPLDLPLQNPLLDVEPSSKSVEKPVESQIELPPSKTSGRRRKLTKRYAEFMTSKDESDDDIQERKTTTAAKPKSPVIDLNKPLTDQLMTIAETTGIQSGLKISNVQSLAITSAENPAFVDNAVKIKTEAVDSNEYDKQKMCKGKMDSKDGEESEGGGESIALPDGLTVQKESEGGIGKHSVPWQENDIGDREREGGLVLPDGMRIKEEPDEYSQIPKRKYNSDGEPQPASKRIRKESESGKGLMSKPEMTESNASKPLDFRKPIQTREEEERIASEAAARAASQALLRVAAKEKEEAGTKAKEDAIKKAQLELQRIKEEEAQRKIREEAQKAASEAASRAASMAMARVVTMELESDVDQKDLEDAAEAARIASEAAARAATEAAKRAATAAVQVSDTAEDLRVAERIQRQAEETQKIASEAAARAAAQGAARAAAAAMQNESPVDLRISSKTDIKQELPDTTQQQICLSQIAEEAAARAVLAAQSRYQNFVPILPAMPLNSYAKPTAINQMILQPDLVLNNPVPNIEMFEAIMNQTRNVNKVVTANKQIITYPKNPSKNLRESLAWKSFQEGVKQGKYKIVQKSDDVAVSAEQNGRPRRVASHSVNVINQDMRCPYCLIQMKVKSNLVEHIRVCLINPDTLDYTYLQSHSAVEHSSVKAPILVCSHCTPNATSVKDLRTWSNVLCRQCVTKCADPKVTERTEDHYVATKSGFFVCKHCGIGLDSEKDMSKHHSQDDSKEDTSTKSEARAEKPNVKVEDKHTSLPVSKILPKKEPDPAFQFRCGQCRLMFASVGLLLVHTSHCNLNQYIKVLERLSFYNCVHCPVACKVVPDVNKPHKCKSTLAETLTGNVKKLQAVRDTSVSSESYVCLRCEEIFPSNGHLILHTKQCNHAQYHLLMRYLDQPPSCNKCLMVFTGYKAYSQHHQKCAKVRQDIEGLAECPLLSFCLRCDKAVQREDADQMYHNAVCVGLPCTKQKLLFPDGFNIKECCTIINSW